MDRFGQIHPKVLLVVLQDGLTLDETHCQDIRTALREQATPRHVPAVIRQIQAVSITINGKKVELAVSKVLRDEAVKNKDALANPEPWINLKE